MCLHPHFLGFVNAHHPHFQFCSPDKPQPFRTTATDIHRDPGPARGVRGAEGGRGRDPGPARGVQGSEGRPE